MENNQETDDCADLETVIREAEKAQATDDCADIEDLLREPETVIIIIEKTEEPPKEEQKTVTREYNDNGATLSDFDIKNHQEPGATQKHELPILNNGQKEETACFEIMSAPLNEKSSPPEELETIECFEVILEKK